MTTLELNKKSLEKSIGRRLSDKEIKEDISMFGTPVGRIEGNKIIVDITPNRPDLLGEQGFARAFSSYLGIKKGLRKYSVSESKKKVIVEGVVSEVRPQIACAIVKGLKFNDETIKEVIKIQEKLHITYGRNRKRCAIGIYPLEKISFPVKYTAKKPNEIKFRPLEHTRAMSGSEILDNHPAGREYRHLLQNKSIYPILIDSSNKILSMPPIINSHDVGKIENGTKDVFVECTGFDINVLKKCLNMVVTSLAETGGKIYSVNVERNGKKIVTPDLEPEKMRLDINYANKRLGLELKESQIVLLLERMGFGYSNKTVLIPTYRTDILHQIDLIEDIAIAYGYTNFKEEIPSVSTIGRENDFERFKNKIANVLVGMGLDEINSTNIVEDKMQVAKMLLDFKPIMLFNSLSSEYNSMRNLILPSLMNALRHNKNSAYPQNIFEIGQIFKRDKQNKTETGIIENSRVAVALCHKQAGFTEIKQKFDRLMKLIGVDYKVEVAAHPSFIPGRVARVIVNGVGIAYLGEVYPKVLHNFEIDAPVAAFELNLTELFEEMN
ncbi:MAG: phenylalanine--tRNA ligase subunit beta [Nanoarchaeota archaeon]